MCFFMYWVMAPAFLSSFSVTYSTYPLFGPGDVQTIVGRFLLHSDEESYVLACPDGRSDTASWQVS